MRLELWSQCLKIRNRTQTENQTKLLKRMVIPLQNMSSVWHQIASDDKALELWGILRIAVLPGPFKLRVVVPERSNFGVKKNGSMIHSELLLFGTSTQMIDYKLFVLHRNTWYQITVFKEILRKQQYKEGKYEFRMVAIPYSLGIRYLLTGLNAVKINRSINVYISL